MRLEFRPQAERDLESIGDCIAQDNPRRAITFLRELRAQCHKILLAPQGCRLRPELGEDIRFCAHGNCVIFFTESDRSVTVIRVLHRAMDIEAKFVGKESDRSD